MNSLVEKVKKRWQFCVLVSLKVNGHIFRDKKSFIYFLGPILGHPVYQFLPKPEFSDFTVSGSGLPMGHRQSSGSKILGPYIAVIRQLYSKSFKLLSNSDFKY